MKKITIAIIGAGPAGLSAALWLKKLGVTPVVIEKESITGGMQNFNFLNNDWVLGQVAATGVQMAKTFYQHVRNENIDVRTHTSMHNISVVNDGGFSISLLDVNGQETTLVCDGIVLANGTRYIGKEILSGLIDKENLSLFEKAIIEGPYTFLEIEKLQNKHVLIVGAGDNAFENASMLLKQDCRVSIVARSTPKAQSQFVDEVVAHPNATVFEHASLSSLFCVDPASQSETKKIVAKINVETGSCELDVDRIHILAGYQANTDSVALCFLLGLGKHLACDDNQFVLVDSFGRTNINRVYAAGDICNIHFPCVVSAIASGALAAKTISQDLLS